MSNSDLERQVEAALAEGRRARKALRIYMAVLVAVAIFVNVGVASADGSGPIQQILRQFFGGQIALSTAADGQAAVWDAATKRWIPGTVASSPHNILSATHGDALAGSVVAGDVVYGNNTPKWARLAKGSNGQVLTLASGLPSWATPSVGSTYPVAPTGGTTTAAGTRAIAVGDAATAGNNDAGAFGYGMVTDANNQFVFGSSGITGQPRFYFGSGVSNVDPQSIVRLQGTGAVSGNTNGSALYVVGGSPSGTGSGGDAYLQGGGGGGRGGHVAGLGGTGTGARGGNVSWVAGQADGAFQGGDISAQGGQGGATGPGGALTFQSGNGGGTSGKSGDVVVFSNTATDGDTGSVTVKTSNAAGSNRSAGDITHIAGLKTGSGANGAHIWQVQGSVEVARINGTDKGFTAMRKVSTVTQAASLQLDVTYSRGLIINTGTSTTATALLPTSTVVGYEFTFVATSANGLTITAPTGVTIRIVDQITATAGSVTSTTIGSHLTLVADSTTSYVATANAGVWN